MKTKKIVGATCWYLGLSALAVGLGVGNSIANQWHSIISTTLQQPESKIVTNENAKNEDTQYFKQDYISDEEREKEGRKLCEEAEMEGLTLLENDGTLPFSSSVKKISLFGMTSVNPVYGGTGSGSIDTSKAATAKIAFESAGYEVNPTLWNFYSSFLSYNENGKIDTKNSKYIRTSASIEGNAGVQYKVNEAPQSEYTAEVKESYANYGDAAVVFIGRSGGEGSDLSMSTDENANGYLALSQNEKDLLQAIQSSSAFDKIIIIINSSNSMELGWMKDYSKIKGAVWVGSVGTTGMNAIAKTLKGEYNPSGRLVDTYASVSTSAPASKNFGNFSYTNAEDLNDINEPYFGSTQWTAKNYVVYQESIYVGYRYYETRYEDTVIGTSNVGDYEYSKAVTYPFGYGKSYTTFEYSNMKVNTKNGDYEVSITVKNTGDKEGKTPVQVYLQQPYTEYDKKYGIEKSAVQLAGFAKTKSLKAGEEETLTMTIDDEEFRSYDAKGQKTYIQDGGDYYLAVGENAHDALNNILAKKGYGKGDGMTDDGKKELSYKISLSQDFKKFSKDATSQNEITNHFENAEITHYFGDTIKYVTRSNWKDTLPTTNVVLTATEELKADLKKNGVDDIKNTDITKYTMPTFGANNGATLITMKGASYDDENWNTILDNLTKEEAIKLVTLGGYKTQAVSSIAYPGTTDKDGPQGISSTLVGGTNKSAMAYTSEVVLAATWNTELVKRIGVAIGNDGLALGVTGWYGPAMNIHRTPFTGRSFEYFSEDPFLSGIIASAEIQGARSKGLITYAKHFAVNDQDTNRKGLATFSSEQAIREIYLRPFELAVKIGKTNGIMESHNRIGAIWAGGSYNLLEDVLRQEWGYQNFVLSDYVGTPVYQSSLQGVLNGLDMQLATNAKADDISANYQDNAYVMSRVRLACHRILYTTVNTAAMNGISQSSKVVSVTPAWRVWLTILLIVFYVGIAVCAFFVTKHFFFPKKNNDAKEVKSE